MDREKLLLTAAILNSKREIEVYEWLALTVPAYGDKPFNKRFETWLNKQASDRFGTEVYKNWGMNGEDKTYPKINFYFRKADWSMNGDKFDLSFNYKGKQAGYDYETKQTVLQEHTENEKLLGLTSAGDIVDWADRIVVNRRENIEKMQHNLKYLKSLAQKRNDLKKMIDEYNDKISYAISDSMRIK